MRLPRGRRRAAAGQDVRRLTTKVSISDTQSGSLPFFNNKFGKRRRKIGPEINKRKEKREKKKRWPSARDSSTRLLLLGAEFFCFFLSPAARHLLVTERLLQNVSLSLWPPPFNCFLPLFLIYLFHFQAEGFTRRRRPSFSLLTPSPARM